SQALFASKKMSGKIKILFVALCICLQARSQNTPEGTAQVLYNESNNTVKFIRLEAGHKVPESGKIEWLRNIVLGAGPDHDFSLIRTTRDELGYVHYKYQQYYKG